MTDAVKFIRSRSSLAPVVGIVLGSGMGPLAGLVTRATRIAYSDIPGFPIATATGHKGEFILGELGGVAVAVMAGRFHFV